MYPYLAYSSNPGRRYRQHQPTQFQFQPNVSFDYDSFAPSSRPTFFAQSQLDDDIDEEEQLLRAALERKRQEKQARQQYRHLLQLEQQREYAALMLREQQYQQEQQAIARVKYEAEQEAIRRYKRELRAQELKHQEQDAWESLVFQNLRQHHQIESQRRARARAVAAHQAQQTQVIAFVQKKPSSDEEYEDKALGALFQHLLSPLAKRTLVQEQSYPCKRRQQCERKEVKHAQAAAAAEKEKEAKAKEAQKKQDQVPASSSKPDQDVAYTDLSTLLEAVFGVPVQTSSSSSSSRCTKPDTSASKTTACAARRGACFAKTANPSTSDSSPELRASDVLCQRQQRQQQQNQTLQQKHSELNLIESALDELSRELTYSLSIYEETDEVKRQVVLATEENITKAMLKIDSVESEGDLSVRQRRKELIRKSQDLLETVDEYKTKEFNTGKQVAKNADESTSGQSESESSAPEVEETRESTVEFDTAESVNFDVEVQAKEAEEEEEDVQPYVVSDTMPQEKDETAVEAEPASVSDSVLVEESVEVAEETPVEKTPQAKATEFADDDDMVVV
ncbi:hypothetical protein BG006_011056 [Podila minutissima]|uniref:BAG domain-containing protein n=1 Tax=Podila minutissima TaxID=64525 RepID=A0A9P5SSM5_9FUNG|nr:hypothetical protein BG006_011056 [Podila minutissima]